MCFTFLLDYHFLLEIYMHYTYTKKHSYIHNKVYILHLFVLVELALIVMGVYADILYDSWSPAMAVSSICISILSMLSSSTVKVWFKLSNLMILRFLYLYCETNLSLMSNNVVQKRPADNDRYVKNCRNGRSPKETRWWFHDDKV